MFGRRKKGFARVETITEFEGEINEDRMREKEMEMEEKKDLLDLLDELDDLEDSEPLEKILELEVVEKTKPQLLADFIRERSIGAYLTSRSSLVNEEDNLEEILLSLKEDESYNDITFIKGDKDLYFYSDKLMSDNYAMIAMLVEEKDLAKIIVEMVRWNAKTYPCPTPVYYFENFPYSYKLEAIEMAIHKINKIENYNDIGEFTTKNNIRYIYSTLHMSEKYAKALAEGTEYGEYGYI